MALKGPIIDCHSAATSARKQSSPATEPLFVNAMCLQLSNWLAAVGRGRCQVTSTAAMLAAAAAAGDDAAAAAAAALPRYTRPVMRAMTCGQGNKKLAAAKK